ncbi:hypothetical protein PP485_gp73 [Gordonia phage ThankyouJordi]|uniref:Uncharacterized protein n=1 Tax=Gordonia phage ThankyouJordi TaxID=2571252 RepID=A0A4Y6ERS8_9CAUD|nr:hypothetical protein PP485_gp73 [Gordonia phage ThankyouJordi]QCW22258.1 hypothetical protein SEA_WELCOMEAYANNA_73 [Gordonia phage WelcomeAyanna]QDF17834.1 hypothetical protein SEA_THANKYOUJORDI_73 [Gordonia phage ThankyouJordi]
MTDHRDVLDRIDAVIRDAEIDELVDWQLARGEYDDGPPASGADLLWREWVFAHEWFEDQLREVALAVAWAANRLAQRLRKRGRL